MANEVEQLKLIVEDQEKQIRLLKQSILRLQQQVSSVSTIAKRAQGQSVRVTEDVRAIKHKLGRN